MKILVYESKGWIGKQFIQILKTSKYKNNYCEGGSKGWLFRNIKRSDKKKKKKDKSYSHY